MRYALYGTGMAIVLASLATPVLAGFVVPEIDGGSMTTGLGVLAGAILILRARTGRK